MPLCFLCSFPWILVCLCLYPEKHLSFILLSCDPKCRIKLFECKFFAAEWMKIRQETDFAYMTLLNNQSCLSLSLPREGSRDCHSVMSLSSVQSQYQCRHALCPFKERRSETTTSLSTWPVFLCDPSKKEMIAWLERHTNNKTHGFNTNSFLCLRSSKNCHTSCKKRKASMYVIPVMTWDCSLCIDHEREERNQAWNF